MSRPRLLLACVVFAGCGAGPAPSSDPSVPGSAPSGASIELAAPPETPRGPGAEAPTASTAEPESDEEPPAPASVAVTPTADRVVLVDGVRSARVWDEREGFRLVVGEGTVALLGPDGHVRASHRFSFGRDDVSAVFVGEGRVIVANGGRDAVFPGPYGGQLDRWDLDSDTIEQLRQLGYTAPSLERVGTGAVVLVEGMLSSVTARGDVTSHDETAEALGCSAGARPRCYVGTATERRRLVVGDDGVITTTEDPGRVPPGRTGRALPRSRGASASLGARGLPSVDLSPQDHRLAISTSSTMLVLGPEGVGEELPSAGDVHWEQEELLRVAGVEHPLDAPTIHRTSLLFDSIPQPLERDVPVPEVEVFDRWRNDALDAESAERRIPPLRLRPVCSRAPPTRCVRAHTAGSLLDGWELFDPARPRQPITYLSHVELPPGAGYVLVTPEGRYVRAALGDVSITDTRTGTMVREIVDWVELEDGWVYVDPSNNRSLRSLSFDGQQVERVFPAAVSGPSIVDATHVFVRTPDGTGHVLEVPSLTTVRSLALGAPAEPPYHCGASGELRAGGAVVDPAGCPVGVVDEEAGRLVRMSRDRAFWMDLRLGDELHVHRTADGAELVVRVTTAGVLVSGPGGVFEGRGAVLDHVVVREPGPVRTAAITTGAEARRRFERPGLVAAFFRGEPLPTPGPSAAGEPSLERALCPPSPPRIDARCGAVPPHTACRYPGVGVVCECRPPHPGAPRIWDCGELGQ